MEVPEDSIMAAAKKLFNKDGKTFQEDGEFYSEVTITDPNDVASRPQLTRQERRLEKEALLDRHLLNHQHLPNGDLQAHNHKTTQHQNGNAAGAAMSNGDANCPSAVNGDANGHSPHQNGGLPVSYRGQPNMHRQVNFMPTSNGMPYHTRAAQHSPSFV